MGEAVVDPLLKVLADVASERKRQDAKWGEQNHPDGTGQYPETIAADVARMACQSAAEGGYLDWLHILREETAEAFAEPDPARLRVELVQVAAVAVAWIEAIDRRASSHPPPARIAIVEAPAETPSTIAAGQPFRWNPAENCYCGPASIYPHRRGTGYYCQSAVDAEGRPPASSPG